MLFFGVVVVGGLADLPGLNELTALFLPIFL